MFNENEEKNLKIEEIKDSLLTMSKEEIEKIELDNIKELQSILLLSHPDTGIEPSMYEIRNFLCDLPYFIIAIHSQYLSLKRLIEKKKELIEIKLGLLRQQAENEIIRKRLLKKNEGYNLSAFGSITKEGLMDVVRTLPDYQEVLKNKIHLGEMESKRDFLSKVVDVLENRRYELGKIIEIEINASKG